MDGVQGVTAQITDALERMINAMNKTWSWPISSIPIDNIRNEINNKAVNDAIFVAEQ